MGHIVTGQQRLGTDPSKTLPYPALMQRITLAEKFAKANGGNLPMTPFWSKLELRFEANPRLFLTSHCNQLNRLLLNDRRAEGRESPIPQNPSQPLIPLPEVVVDNPPVTGTNPPGSGDQGGGTIVPPPDNGGGFTPSPVPEPASAMLLGLGICGVLLARRLRGRRDHR